MRGWRIQKKRWLTNINFYCALREKNNYFQGEVQIQIRNYTTLITSMRILYIKFYDQQLPVMCWLAQSSTLLCTVAKGWLTKLSWVAMMPSICRKCSLNARLIINGEKEARPGLKGEWFQLLYWVQGRLRKQTKYYVSGCSPQKEKKATLKALQSVFHPTWQISRIIYAAYHNLFVRVNHSWVQWKENKLRGAQTTT